MGVLVILFGLGVTFLRWWILLVFWGWFMYPVFNLPMLSYWEMAGVSFFISTLTVSVSWADIETRDTKEHLTKTISYLVIYLFGFGMGFLIHLCQ